MVSDEDTPRENVYVTGGDGPEKADLVLGFVPLTDCAVLAIAKEKGFFSSHGLNVSLSREPSRAPIASTLGIT